MKSVTDILHRTPWWALLFTALAIFVALAVFVTPYHILQYREDGGKTTEESRAIKRELDNAFAENAINVGRGVIRGMLSRTTDPERRAELEEALHGLEEARRELRDAGTEALRTKREALASARQATRASLEAIRNARREAEAALKLADPADTKLRQQLQEQIQAAEGAEREARVALETKAKRIIIGPTAGKGPAIDIEIDGEAPPPVPPVTPIPNVTPPADLPAPPLPPDVATKIRRDVTGDMYRLGIGAALILVLVPLFVLAIVTKFFADRSRVSQKVAEAKRREAEYHRMGQQVTEAKLAALQAQVEPHFLYNTLASVQALTEVDPAKANEMTGHLIQYLRNALPKMRESVSTVGQEVELVRAYLSILQMRMGSRLTFDIDVPQELMALPFPPLMLPSLVENAIKHGLEPQREGGSVRIGASRDNGTLRLTVTDTGRGFAETIGAGVGLANIRERLAALYGERAHLDLVANEPHGVVATIQVPAEGTRSSAAPASAAAGSTASSRDVPPPIPAPLPVALDGTSPAKVAKSGFWARTLDMMIVFERGWRKAIYWLYLALLVVAALVAVAAVIGIAIGAFPVVMDDDVLTGPAGALVGLAAAIVGFVAAAAALALVMLVLYGLGFFFVALAIFVALVAVVAISPLVAPFALFGLFVWWMAKRSKRRAEGAAAEPAR